MNKSIKSTNLKKLSSKWAGTPSTKKSDEENKQTKQDTMAMAIVALIGMASDPRNTVSRSAPRVRVITEPKQPVVRPTRRLRQKPKPSVSTTTPATSTIFIITQPEHVVAKQQLAVENTPDIVLPELKKDEGRFIKTEMVSDGKTHRVVLKDSWNSDCEIGHYVHSSRSASFVSTANVRPSSMYKENTLACFISAIDRAEQLLKHHATHKVMFTTQSKNAEANTEIKSMIAFSNRRRENGKFNYPF